jgi:hypothetical protein
MSGISHDFKKKKRKRKKGKKQRNAREYSIPPAAMEYG